VITFEEVFQSVDQVPGSFIEESCRALFAQALKARGILVEVGVDQGRSASVLLHAVSETGAELILVDSCPIHISKVQALIESFPNARAEILFKDSVTAALDVPGPLSLIHIDADHYGTSPAEDCRAWLPKIEPGGVACFHDYGSESTFPEVTLAVDKYTKGWEDLGTWGGLAVRRR